MAKGFENQLLWNPTVQVIGCVTQRHPSPRSDRLSQLFGSYASPFRTLCGQWHRSLKVYGSPTEVSLVS